MEERLLPSDWHSVKEGRVQEPRDGQDVIKTKNMLAGRQASGRGSHRYNMSCHVTASYALFIYKSGYKSGYSLKGINLNLRCWGIVRNV
jgi:hypothetical protein